MADEQDIQQLNGNMLIHTPHGVTILIMPTVGLQIGFSLSDADLETLYQARVERRKQQRKIALL